MEEASESLREHLLFKTSSAHLRSYNLLARKRKMALSEDPFGMGSSKLPISLGKMADFGEQKEKCRVSELVA